MDNKIYLIDAMAYVFRAYYGFGTELTNAQGFPTKAIFGFKNMLRAVLQGQSPQYLVMVFDASGKSFRNEIYPEYKANRESAPEDLKVQFAPIKELVKILNIPTIEKTGWEADDLIAELSRQFSSQVEEVVIVSGDKDLTQLINDKVSMYDGMKNVKYRAEDVKKKYGVYPEQIAEYLALVGDSSDNIPGARGIGPKTAEKLFEDYQTIEKIYQNLEQIKPAVSKKLKESEQNVKISLELTNLNHKIGLDYQLKDFTLKKADQKELRQFYYKYGFAQDSLLDESEQKIVTEKEQPVRKYRLINHKEILQEYLKQILQKKKFAFDLETTSIVVQDAEIVGIAIAVEGLDAGYIPVAHQENSPQLDLGETLDSFQEIFQNEQIQLIAHNLKYEVSVLKNYNITLKNQLEDTMLQSYLIASDSHQHGLDRLAKVYLNHECIPFSEVAGSGKNQVTFDKIAIEKAFVYAAEDAEVTAELFEILNPKIRQQNLEKLYRDVEIPLCLLLSEIERKGVKINEKLLLQLAQEMRAYSEVIAQEIYQEVGEQFNLNSPKQLGEILFEKLAIQEFKKKTKTGYSTDSGVLEKLSKNYPIAHKIQTYRIKQKLINTYLEVLPKLVHHTTGRIHTSYHQTIAATGRLSSKDPNLQNIPIRGEDGKHIREAFIAGKDYCLVSADYSQIELRVLAHLCEDQKLIQAFQQKKDIHNETAANIFQVSQDKVDAEMRSVAKAINFGIIYGMGATKLSAEIGVSRKEATEFIKTYFSKYPKIQLFVENTIAEAKKSEFVSTILGRKRQVKGINDKNMMLRAAMERIAVNTRIQGSAADIIKLAMIKIYQQTQKNHIIMQIHDELVFEVLEKEVDNLMPLWKEKMEKVYPLKVPLQVEIQKGENWSLIH